MLIWANQIRICVWTVSSMRELEAQKNKMLYICVYRVAWYPNAWQEGSRNSIGFSFTVSRFLEEEKYPLRIATWRWRSSSGANTLLETTTEVFLFSLTNQTRAREAAPGEMMSSIDSRRLHCALLFASSDIIDDCGRATAHVVCK
jgi:hypothetical protein